MMARTAELFTKRQLRATLPRRRRQRKRGAASIPGLRFRWTSPGLRDRVLCRTWAGLQRRFRPFCEMASGSSTARITFEVCDAHGKRLRIANIGDYRAFEAERRVPRT